MKRTRDRTRNSIRRLSRKLYDSVLGAADCEKLLGDNHAGDDPVEAVSQFDAILNRATAIVARSHDLGGQTPLQPFFRPVGEESGKNRGAVVVRELPDFASDAAAYLARHHISPGELIGQIERLLQVDGFKVLDETSRLRAAPLHAPDGSEETILAIHLPGILFLVSILNERINERQGMTAAGASAPSREPARTEVSSVKGRRKRSKIGRPNNLTTESLVRTLAAGCNNPAEALEIYYWSQEPGLIEMIRGIAAMPEDARAAIEAFIALAHDVKSVKAVIDPHGVLTLASADVARAVSASQYVVAEEDKVTSRLLN